MAAPATDSLLITVAICTWNRSALLAATLEKLTKLSVPDDLTWELLVINNNCTDDTDAVIERYKDRLPLRRIFEERLGQSNARNAGVANARGRYLVWTDDDVLVDSNWLIAYRNAFARHPSGVVFGGPIEPWFEGTPPSWLQRGFAAVAGAYAALDLGTESRPLDHDHYPFGANMVFVTEALRARMFDPRLGRTGTGALRGEEMLMIRSLFAEGAEGWWVPEAKVQHWVPADRQTIQYLREYYLAGGKALALLGEARGSGRLVFGRPMWLWRQAAEAEARYWMYRLLASPERWVEQLKTASVSWGWIRHFAETPLR